MPQDGICTALELAPKGPATRVVGSKQGDLFATENLQEVLDALADPGLRIVSLTVSEKGYCHEPATGRLNLDQPDIRHDLEHPLPVSAPGYLVRALQLRRAAGLLPFTVLTCDNCRAMAPCCATWCWSWPELWTRRWRNGLTPMPA